MISFSLDTGNIMGSQPTGQMILWSINLNDQGIWERFPCFSPPFGVTNMRFGRYHLPRLDANQRNIANGYTQNDAIKTIILGIQYPCERSWVYITWEKALGWKTEPHDKSQWLLWFYGSLLCSLHGSGNICFQLATLQRGIHGHLVSMKMVTPSGILSFLSFAIFCS